MSHVAVLGAGSWGTVLADLLAGKDLEVRIWAYEPEVARAITTQHENPLFLPGRQLHHKLVADDDIVAVVRGASAVCSVVPSHVTRATFASIASVIPDRTPLVCASKGIEADSLQLLCDVARETLPHCRYVVLSGPSFAEEVHAGQPTAVVAASADADAAGQVQQLLSTRAFRVYTDSDVIGVSTGGSLKNAVAIAAGILEGMGLGNNPRAALLTRGLAEITRLGVAMGAEQATFAGLAGMGDLLLTCTGALSRNRQLGIALANGTTLDQYYSTHRTVVEGVNTALAATRLASRLGVDMPITRQVECVLFEGTAPRDALQALMERTLKPERSA